MPGKGPPRTLSAERAREIVQLFNEGVVISEIADRFGIGRTTVNRTLKRLGVAKPRDRAKPRIDKDIKTALVAACQGGTPINEVAQRFEVSRGTVARALRNKAITLKIGRPPCHALDHGAFSVLTREALYWLGFIFTDGCIISDAFGAPIVALNIQIGDRSHVENFRSFLKSNHAITVCAPGESMIGTRLVRNSGSVTFRVRSERLVAALQSYGMTWKKADRGDIHPALVTSADFWRGCIDGDGTIGLSDDRYAAISLVGYTSMLEHFKRFLLYNGLADLQITPTTSGIWRIGTTAGPARRIINALYGKGGPALQRKNEGAQLILKTIKP